MTKADFIKEFGQDWRKFSNKPMFAALLAVIDTESPAKKITGKSDNDRLHGAAVFINEIHGWESLRSLIAGLSDVPEKDFEPAENYKDPEKI